MKQFLKSLLLDPSRRSDRCLLCSYGISIGVGAIAWNAGDLLGQCWFDSTGRSWWIRESRAREPLAPRLAEKLELDYQRNASSRA